MLIVCDFDGTVTQVDTLDHLAQRFAPETYAQMEGSLFASGASLREVLRAELAAIAAPAEDVIAAAISEVPFRPGFSDLVDGAEQRGHEIVLISAGFRQLIEPMLDAAGLGGRLKLIANDVEFGNSGAAVAFREQVVCGLCAEHCKRAEVQELTAAFRSTAASADQHVVYIGDGYSDRCAAESVDTVFARSGLATYLDERGVSYLPFGTFDDVVKSLGERW